MNVSGIGMLLKSFGVDVDSLIADGKQMVSESVTNITKEVTEVKQSLARIESKLDAIDKLLSTGGLTLHETLAASVRHESTEEMEYGANGDGGTFDTSKSN